MNYPNEKQITATVVYHLATYIGEIEVNCNENDEDDLVIDKAKRILRQKTGSLPMGYESWKVIRRD